MSVGKRLRFEILKRDGFRCRYCGVTAVVSMLHVDHVVPVAEAGTDDPANLVTACAGCNLGKSDVELETSQIATVTAEAMHERAEQVHEYLAALRAFEAERQGMREMYAEIWRTRCFDDPPMVLFVRFDTIDAEHGYEAIIAAMDAVSAKTAYGRMSVVSQAKYFYGVLRRRRERAEGRDV